MIKQNLSYLKCTN